MTADELALLRGVEASPDDDLPRLVYADWLDEHGRHARAEFIRVQCELASIERRLPGMTIEQKRVEGPRRGELSRAQREMLKNDRDESVGGVQSLKKCTLRQLQIGLEQHYHRGFLSEFHVFHLIEELEDAICFCSELIPRPHIIVRNVANLLISADRLVSFDRQQVWSAVNELHVYHHSHQVLLPHELIPMMKPVYSALKELSAYNFRLTSGHICVIAERLNAPKLEVLNIAMNDILDSGVAFLHRAIYAKCLQEINLSQNPICRPENSTLTKRHFPSLRFLDLTDCPIMPQSLAQLRNQLPGVEVIC